MNILVYTNGSKSYICPVKHTKLQCRYTNNLLLLLLLQEEILRFFFFISSSMAHWKNDRNKVFLVNNKRLNISKIRLNWSYFNIVDLLTIFVKTQVLDCFCVYVLISTEPSNKLLTNLILEIISGQLKISGTHLPTIQLPSVRYLSV